MKKDQWKVFILKFGKLTQYFCIKSIFWTIKTIFYICEGTYLRASVQQHKLKRDENMILNSCCEWFSKTEVFLQAFKK